MCLLTGSETPKMLSLMISCSALNDELQNTYSIPYPIIFGPYRGDTWDASQIYRLHKLSPFKICRGFATEEAPWASTPLQQRKDTPSWFLELPMWVRLTT